MNTVMSAFRLRIKVLLADRTATICYITAAVVIAAVLLTLNIYADTGSRIPIGVLCEDNSNEAAKLLKALEENEALYVCTDTQNELERLLNGGFINCIFVIDEGYGEKVNKGITSELITVYGAKDDKISSALADICAGCMMYDICINKTYNLYSSLDNYTNSRPEYKMLEDRTEYVSYALTLRENENYQFAFDTVYMDPRDYMKEVNVTNALIYRQMIAGIIVLLLSLVTFCTCNHIAEEHECAIMMRLKSKEGFGLKRKASDIAAIWVYLLPVNVVTAVCMYKILDINDMIRLFTLNSAFTLFFALFFYVSICIIKKVSVYQIFGALTVVLFGALGFISVFSGFTGAEHFGYIPDSVYIKLFLEII